MSNLSDVTIAITAFLRPGYLNECLNGIETNLPECKIIVADDSEGMDKSGNFSITLPLRHNETFLSMPYDSGLTAKRNAIITSTETKYFLLGCDDFDFSTAEVREGILKLIKVLDENPGVDVACGRYGNAPYEGTLEYVPGHYIREHRLVYEPGQEFYKIDIGVNYFLARTSTLKEIPWDASIGPIGGEHVDFFLDLKEANKTVVWVPGVNINQQTPDMSKQDPRYGTMRSRCWDGHTLMKKKRNVKSYVDFGGHIS